ncbi:MAG: hypothetical protein M5R36_17455 [Deltaproteobacteria bacterium]|nr:hypothetical protein [Deltaproteobacteria bacterium]
MPQERFAAAPRFGYNPVTMRRGILLFVFTLSVLAAFPWCGGGDDDDSSSSSARTPDDDDVADDDAAAPDDDTDNDPDDDADDDAGDDDADDDDDEIPTPECASYGEPEEVGAIESDELVELSGLAFSRKNPGVVWGLNDSGGGAKLFAMTPTGAHLGVARVAGALNLDWEDLSIGRCGGDWCLYVGDIGDNPEARLTKIVYVVAEPEVDAVVPFGQITIDVWDKLVFDYPDAKHDAESLAWHPDGRLFVISKARPGERRGFTCFRRTRTARCSSRSSARSTSNSTRALNSQPARTSTRRVTGF